MTTERLLIPIHCDHDRRLEYLTLDQLEEFQEDLVELSPEGYAHLRDSILKHGIIAPIFFWRNPDDPEHTPKILDGHQRKKVCLQEGWQIEGGAWPVVDIQAPSEQAAAEILLHLRGQHGQMSDQGLYDFIIAKDIDVDRLLDFDLPGFDLEDFKADFFPDQASGHTDPDEVPPEPEEPVTQTGDLWRMGAHRLLCGDSTKAEDVERVRGGENISLLIADPPYGMRLDTDFSGMKNRLDFAQGKGVLTGRKYDSVIGDDTDYDAASVEAIVKDIQEQFWFGADYYSKTLSDTQHHGSWLVWDKRLDESADRMFGSCFELIWSKKKRKRDILRYKWASIFGSEQEPVRGRVHPNQKPVALLADLIRKGSSQGEGVLDLYSGSGNVIIAADQEQWICYGLEILPSYCDVIVNRWQNYTGQQATLDGDGRTFAEMAEERGVAV